MKDSTIKYCKVFLNLLTALVILLLVIFVLPRLIGFFMPFVVAGIIAFLANPLVHFLDKRLKIKRKAGTAIVIVAAIALVVGVFYAAGSVLLREAVGFFGELPALWRAMEEDFAVAGKALEDFFSYMSPDLKQQLDTMLGALNNYIGGLVNNLSTPTVTAVGNFAKVLPGFFVGLIMCLLSSYFFVAEREEIMVFARKYLPEEFRKKWMLLFSCLKNAVGGYFKAQLKIEIWIYLLLVLGLSVLGVKYALIIALGIAFLDFWPVFGTGAVLWPWALIKVLGGDYQMALGLMIMWGLGQLVRQLIQPKIVGDSIGVPAIPTLFLLFIGYKVGSVAGMILAVPAGIILSTMYQAGFFSTTEDSLRILVKGFNDFRRLTEEDKKDIGKKEKEE